MAGGITRARPIRWSARGEDTCAAPTSPRPSSSSVDVVELQTGTSSISRVVADEVNNNNYKILIIIMCFLCKIKLLW